jgi:hypothetical protein
MKRLIAVVVPVLLGVVVGAATPAAAAKPIIEAGVPGTPIAGTYPAGVACSFPVSFEVVSGGEQTVFTYLDNDGNFERQVTVAKASVWRFTNLSSSTSVIVPLVADRTEVTVADDGTVTVTISGGVIGFNAPTDTPPGPFALAISGHLIFVIAPSGAGTITQRSGKVIDLCDAVS